MKFGSVLGLFLCLFVISAQSAFAIVDPRESANNRFGIHIIDRGDFQPAAELVNSNGGEWGYVTMVIREDQRDTETLQQQFDELREKKLIPIVRIATHFADQQALEEIADAALALPGALAILG